MLLLLAAMLLPAVAAGQASSTGTVAGTVKDSAGNVVVGASLALKSQERGVTTTAKSNGAGEYVFNAVPVGKYTLTVKAATFSAYSVQNVIVDANQNVSQDAVLAGGSADTTVTVTADSSVVDVRSATIGFSIDQNLVENLPLDGNNAIEVAAILPGVTDLNAPTTFTNDAGGPTYNISGSRNNQNLLLLDGAIWNNLYNNTGLNFPPSQALAEVSVLTNGFKAQYGRNVGSVFNVLTKSGANVFHGTVYDIVQNSFFNAADYLSLKNPHLVQNQFGGTIGGPILKNKMFFFLAYQDLRSSAGVIGSTQTFSAAERGLNSDGTQRPCLSAAFAGYSCASFAEDFPTVPTGKTQTLARDPFANYVPGTGQCAGVTTNNLYINCVAAVSAVNAAWTQAGNIGTSPCPTLLSNAAIPVPPATVLLNSSLTANAGDLPNNEIPSVCFNPVSVRLLAYQPLPTIAQGGATLSKAITEAKQPRNDQNILFRVDYNLKRHTLDARYYQTGADDQTAPGVNSQGVGIATYGIDHNRANTHFGGIGDTYVLTPNLLNVLRLDYKRYVYTVTPNDHTTLADLGSNYTQPGDNTLPAINFQSRTLSLGVTNNNNLSIDEDVEVDDSITWTHGKHNYQAGLEYLRLQYLTSHTNSPSFTFATNFTGNTSSDYILGLIASGVVQNATNQAAIQHDLYMYVQDDWRITPKLTLNLGLRYEIPFQWYQPDGQASTFIPGYQSIVFPNSPPNLAFVGDPGVERSLVGTTYHSVAPRFGFAYDVFGNGKTAIRGGFGVFYDAINALVVGISSPYHYLDNTTENPGGISQPLLGLPAVPNNYVKGQAPQFVQPYSITFPDKNFTTPYTMSMNFGIQQRLSSTASMQVNYVGHLSRHLPIAIDLNPSIYDCTGPFSQIDYATYCRNANASTASYNARAVYPGFNQSGGVLDYMTVGQANYHALQAVFTMRSGKTLTTTASYTYSKSMDDQSNTNISNASDGPNVDAHYAPSDFNAKHIFNIGWVLRYPARQYSFRPVGAVLNGWSLNGIYTGRTGHPFSAISQTDTTLRHEYNQYLSLNPALGPSYVPLPSNRHRTAKIAEWFNTADVMVPILSTPGPSAYGNIQRNSLTDPAFQLLTLAVQRTFTVAREKTFIFRLDAINAFNTPNLGNPSNSESSGSTANSTFGTIISTAGGNAAVGTNGRRLQLSGTFRF